MSALYGQGLPRTGHSHPIWLQRTPCGAQLTPSTKEVAPLWKYTQESAENTKVREGGGFPGDRADISSQPMDNLRYSRWIFLT